MARSSNRPIALVALLVGAAVLLVVLLNSGGSNGRTFYAVVPAAEDVLRGSEINAGGHAVGSVNKVTPIDGGRAAKIKMRISDEDYWPLARDSRLEIRYGGTVSFSNRYLLLTRGKDRAHLLGNGDTLPEGAVKTPVEVDQFVNDFPATTRKDFQKLLGNAAPVLEQGGDDLKRVLAPNKAPLVTTGAGKLTADLTENVGELRTLVHSTARVLTAADSANPDLRTLLDGFAQTASAIADESSNLKTTLSQFPAALRQTRTTLGKADATLRDAGDLTDKLGPGVTQLHASVKPLRAVMARLKIVAPLGANSLRKAKDIDPVVAALIHATKLMPAITSIAKQSATQLDCLRPYAPELAHFGEAWGDFTGYTDTKDRIVRANVQNFLPAGFNSIPYTAGQAAKLFPGIDYGFPRPPGGLAHQPWFQPQCGITEKSVDPAQDPESADFVKNRSGK
jgi:ABC-type transporter Mla subunit MlaD